MNARFERLSEKGKLFREEYGKVSAVVVFLFVILACAGFIISSAIPQKLRVSFLDIGQGDSILIQTPSGHEMLIDGGPSDLVLTRLNEEMSYFNRDIDVMIATHPDSDHVTGLIPVMEKYEVKHIVVSGDTSETGVFADLDDHIGREGADVHVANRGDVIDFQDGVTATVLHPYVGEKWKDTNSASVSVVVKYGDESFLLTGDLPSTNEPLLLSSGLLPKNITVYKAGHHGSKYSSGEQLLTYIRPEYAVISAGKDNKYGHPNPEAITRLEKYSKEILSTIDRGTISFATDGKTIDVETQK
jgi:competence protein ComEC